METRFQCTALERHRCLHAKFEVLELGLEMATSVVAAVGKLNLISTPHIPSVLQIPTHTNTLSPLAKVYHQNSDMQIFFALSTGRAPEPSFEPSVDVESSQEKENGDKHSRDYSDKQLNESLKSTVVTKKTNITWSDVAGLAKAKMELQIAAELPMKFPQLFRGRLEPHKFILLYGPPGTGKGHLIKALASGVNSTLFTISSSDIQSKWYGESERLVNNSLHRIITSDNPTTSSTLGIRQLR
jgi:SpoVK/Ycf46/Vps4 family AAA+-type ATPase